MVLALKRLFVFVLLALITSGIIAQSSKKKVPNLPTFDEKPVHFGFLIGFNTMNFNVLHSGALTEENEGNPLYAEVLNLQPGINLGIVSSFRINKNLNFRLLPGISFGQRDLTFIDQNQVQEDKPLQVKSTFLEMPMMIKYSSLRMHNFKPYLVAGINPRYDLAKNKQDGLLLKSLDMYYEVGLGFDSYLNYFRLSTELKISIGMRDMLDHNGTGEIIDLPYTQAIDRLTSRMFVLSFYFE
ncbi:PorT family protein [Labilibacter sediminis]|nr:PorT family protein [Labilibacter sediminis]